MGRVQPVSSDINSTLGYFARASYLLPSYMFIPPNRQHSAFYKAASCENSQALQDLLRTNMLFNWMRGDYGPIDDFTISAFDIENVIEEMTGHPIDKRFPTIRLIVGKELKYWDHILNGDKRRKPLKIKEPFKYPVMDERLDAYIGNIK